MASRRRVAALLALVLILVAIAILWRRTPVPVTDYTCFWIAGHRLLQHGNPYDAAYALPIERAMGFRGPGPFAMRNPPWTLIFVLPLGLVDHSTGWLLWTCALLVMVALSASLVWRIYRGPASRNWIPILLAIVFAPAIACLSVGQAGPIVLLGLTLFLYFQPRSEFRAGAALVLAAFKPQLAFLFWLALAAWCVEQRRWKIVAGAVSTAIATTAVAIVLDPLVLSEYRGMLADGSIARQFIPTLGGWLRHLFGPAWLQVAPAVLGVVWLVAYYIRHRKVWDWRERLPVLVLASMLLTPYAWLVDEVVVLLPLVAVAWAVDFHRHWKVTALFVFTNAAILVALALGVRVVSPYYVWTMWVWIGFYVLARRGVAPPLAA